MIFITWIFAHTTIECNIYFLRRTGRGAKTYKGLHRCKLIGEIVIVEKLPVNVISNHMEKLINKLVIRMIEQKLKAFFLYIQDCHLRIIFTEFLNRITKTDACNKSGAIFVTRIFVHTIIEYSNKFLREFARGAKTYKGLTL